MDKLRTGILRQVATQVMKAPTQTSTRLSASTSTHRRSSSTSSATPPARTEPKAGIPGAGRKAGTQPGAPEAADQTRPKNLAEHASPPPGTSPESPAPPKEAKPKNGRFGMHPVGPADRDEFSMFKREAL